MRPTRWTAPLTAVLLTALAACAGVLDDPIAHAAPNAAGWPPVWQDTAQTQAVDDTPPAFERPMADHCRRAPTTREVSGGPPQSVAAERRRHPEALGRTKGGVRDEAAAAATVEPSRNASISAFAERADVAAAVGAAGERAVTPSPWPTAPVAQPQAPVHPPVTAAMQDDNADFGEYLAYRQRHPDLPVRDRDIRERYLLEVTDAAGRPVHDAEVAIQRPGVAEPVMWARSDAAGRVWLHPRAFLPTTASDARTLGVAVRKGALQARAVLLRGQSQAVQVRLGGAPVVQRPRLDLVFLIDATGSMGDEIAKLKASMRSVAQQIARMPGQPDICYGLVSYRDRGDAYLTRSHDFTDDLGAFQGVLARVEAGGGGDMPEALNEALHETVHALRWRADAARLVVLVADAPPHLDYAGPQYDRDMQAALAKGIKLFAVGASGLDPVGEYIYRQMAQYTAGRFVFLTYQDAADPGSGPGTQTTHDVGTYSVQTLDRLIVRLVGDEVARLARS